MAEIGIGSAPFSSMLIDRMMPDHKLGKVAEGLAEKVGGGGQKSFLETLKDTIGEVNQIQTKADEAARKFSAGEGGNLHDVMIAMEKADISIRTLGSVRNKLVEAYQEIMRMQV